jgi:uncharacterized protein YjbI with pentapeptide repeats
MNTLPRLRKALWGLGFVVFLIVAWYLLEYVPHQTASQIQGDVPKRLEAFNAARATGAQIFLGFGVLIGLGLAYMRLRTVQRQAETTALQAETAARQAKSAEDGQITERFTRAIDQLGAAGDDKMAIRLGGIYALERILRDSETDAPTVQEVLAAFVREELERRSEPQKVPAEGPTAEGLGTEGGDPLPLDTDLKAALSVLGRNPQDRRRPDLRGVDLGHRDLRGLPLARLNLSGAHLTGTHLSFADLTNAYLFSARLTGARLSEINLTKAKLIGADLNGADLSRAVLTGANLTDTDLFRADLTGAINPDLSRVRRLPDGTRPAGPDRPPEES